MGGFVDEGMSGPKALCACMSGRRCESDMAVTAGVGREGPESDGEGDAPGAVSNGDVWTLWREKRGK